MNKTALLLASIFIASAPALAADPAWLTEFRKADLNDSGGLSRLELDKTKATLLKPVKENFTAIDADKDGHATPAEYQAYQKAASASKSTAAPADQCRPDCGVVIALDRYKIQGEGSALGAIAGGVAGGLLGSQVGGGTGKTVATVGGIAGGAYAGHQVEKRMRTKKMVKITVKLDNGQQQNFDIEADKSPFPRGARVQVKDGKLEAYTGQ